jgi:phosphatidylinositol-3-phosphatase
MPATRCWGLDGSEQADWMRGAPVGLAMLLLVTACGAPARSADRGSPAPRSLASASTAAAPSRATTPLGAEAPSSPAHPSRVAVPRPDHVVVVVLENHSYGEVLGNPGAPFIASIAASGATFTRSFAVTHPSQPNYLALFSGSTLDISDDSCPHSFSSPNLARALLDAGDRFVGYSEGLPSPGFTGCSSGAYARKHNPWVNFTNVPASVNQPFTAFPADYAALPSVSFVIPDLEHDMHDGTIGQADRWLHDRLGPYVAWAPGHRSILMLTFDEDDQSANNRVLTIVAGASVRPGRYAEHIDHYRLLRTLTDAFHLTPLGAGAATPPITDIWSASR